MVHKITDTFNKISKDIITIKVRLNDDHQQTSVSELIGKIQDQEQKKLEIVRFFFYNTYTMYFKEEVDKKKLIIEKILF